MDFLSDSLVQEIKTKAISLNDHPHIVMSTIYELDVREYWDKIQRDPEKLQDNFWEQLEMRMHRSKVFLEDFWRKQNSST